jgi:hypothetical protein
VRASSGTEVNVDPPSRLAHTAGVMAPSGASTAPTTYHVPPQLTASRGAARPGAVTGSSTARHCTATGDGAAPGAGAGFCAVQPEAAAITATSATGIRRRIGQDSVGSSAAAVSIRMRSATSRIVIR